MVSPEERRAAVAHLRQVHGASERRACGLVGQPRASQRYQCKPVLDDGLREEVVKIAAEQPRFGYRRITAVLKRRGFRVWHGRVHRITKELRLQVKVRKRKRIRSAKPVVCEITRVNQRWGMDFVTDSLAHGRSFRALAIIDHHTRECPVIEVDLSLPGARVVRVLERLRRNADYLKPSALTMVLSLCATRCAGGVRGRKCVWITSSPASPCKTGM
jgi:putative transposase